MIRPLSPLALCGLACSVAAAAPLAGEDAQEALRARLTQRGLKDVRCDLREGVLTLRGRVANQVAKREALRLARTQRGVEALIDLLEVDRLERPSAELRQDVRDALGAHPGTEARHLRVFASDSGVVRLEGWAETPARVRLIRSVVSGVRGVQRVDLERVEVRHAERSDEAIADEVRRQLLASSWVEPLGVDVSVEGGDVRLRGAVTDLDARARLLALVERVPGVQRVSVAELKLLDPERAGEEALPFDRPSDAELRATLRASLRLDPRVPAHEAIEVSVESGVATLRGVVSHALERVVAARDAAEVRGVWRVRNHLVVASHAPPEKLLERVRTSFARDPFLADVELKLTFEQGALRLSGPVETAYLRQRAGWLARLHAGPSRVINELRAQRDLSPEADAKLASEIKAELFWASDVAAERVEVTVRDGVAYLQGQVATPSAKRSALRKAQQAGAERVVDRLNVPEPSEATK